MMINPVSSSSIPATGTNNTECQPPSKKRKTNDKTALSMRAPQINTASTVLNNPFGNGPRANSSISFRTSQPSFSITTPTEAVSKNPTALDKAVVKNDRKRLRDEMFKDFDQLGLTPSTTNNLDDAIEVLGAFKV